MTADRPERETIAREDVREALVWRCFHCAEVFTGYSAAAEHFGEFEDCTPACKIGVELFRKMETELARWRSEDDHSTREFYALGAKHVGELRREEERGYERGLADGRALSRSAPEPRGGVEGLKEALERIAARQPVKPDWSGPMNSPMDHDEHEACGREWEAWLCGEIARKALSALSPQPSNSGTATPPRSGEQGG